MSTARTNPLLTSSTEPHGIPPFGVIRAADYPEAFEVAVTRQSEAVDAITDNEDRPDFHNTIEPLEASGQLVTYVSDAFFHQLMAGDTPDLVAMETGITALLTRHEERITGNRRLAARVAAMDVSEAPSAQSRRLIELWQRRFRRAGAIVEPEQASKLAKVNAELAKLTIEYRQYLVQDGDAKALVVDDAAALEGLPADQVEQAREEAARRGLPGYVLRLSAPSSQPGLAHLADRETRRRLHEASLSRAPENAERASRIAHLRAMRAQLLGYSTHAAYVTEEETAGSLKGVEAMFARLAPAVLAAAVAERGALSAGGSPSVEPWDWAFRAEQLKVDAGVDEASLRPYFELEAVLHEGLFHTARELYGLRFDERHDVTGHHPEVRVFDVLDSDGSPRGLFTVDFWARLGKRGGAWMSTLTQQAHLTGAKPVVACTFNLARPTAEGPCLLAPAEVTQLFHEFGHALHALLSDVAYPSFTAPGVPRDFSEAPAQVHEAWAWQPEVLAHYARHHQTGEPLPAHWAGKLTGHANGSGFALAEILGAACLDWAWHTRTADQGPGAPDEVESSAAAAFGMNVPQIPPRYRSGYFDHVFVGPYGALFYSYIWSEIIAANLWEWFQSQGGLSRQAGETFRERLLARGGAEDAMSMFRELTGGEPHIEPFLRRRGLGAFNNEKDEN